MYLIYQNLVPWHCVAALALMAIISPEEYAVTSAECKLSIRGVLLWMRPDVSGGRESPRGTSLPQAKKMRTGQTCKKKKSHAHTDDSVDIYLSDRVQRNQTKHVIISL